MTHGLNHGLYNAMPHYYNRIWLHTISATKYRQPLITTDVEQGIYRHMQEQLVEIGCPVRIINGMPEHIHLLYLQNPKIAVMDIVKQVKGNTSNWINEQDLIIEKFAWQTGFATYSVSDSQVEKVFRYIADQKEHHAKKSFIDEYEEFILHHGLIFDPEENG